MSRNYEQLRLNTRYIADLDCEKRTAELKQLFFDTFVVEPDNIMDGVVYVGDLQFWNKRSTIGEHDCWQVIYHCPICNCSLNQLVVDYLDLAKFFELLDKHDQTHLIEEVLPEEDSE